jgi:rRNA maturation endonuclease Nob1
MTRLDCDRCHVALLEPGKPLRLHALGARHVCTDCVPYELRDQDLRWRDRAVDAAASIATAALSALHTIGAIAAAWLATTFTDTRALCWYAVALGLFISGLGSAALVKTQAKRLRTRGDDRRCAGCGARFEGPSACEDEEICPRCGDEMPDAEGEGA